MKSEDEIRRHIADLRISIKAPCGCPPDAHDCKEGGLMMEAVVRALEWALGESPEYDKVVEHIGQLARKWGTG